MYLEHFGLREAPFTLTPDTEFFFNHGSHQEALNVLLVAVCVGLFALLRLLANLLGINDRDSALARQRVEARGA